MAHSIELRVPFLDYRLVEFCFFLPARYKIRNGVHKALVREVMARFMPETARTRQKKAFGAIQTEWFRKHLKDELRALLTSPSFRARGYWNEKEAALETEAFHRGEGANSFFLWQCVNLELWFRTFID